MAYQRLQVTRALPVHATTTGINIPDPDFAGITGANATSATSKLTVAAADTFTANSVQAVGGGDTQWRWCWLGCFWRWVLPIKEEKEKKKTLAKT